MGHIISMGKFIDIYMIRVSVSFESGTPLILHSIFASRHFVEGQFSHVHHGDIFWVNSLVNLQAHCTIKGFAAGVTEVGLVKSLGTLSQFGGNPSYAMHSNSWQHMTKCRQVGVSMVAILLTFSSLTVTLSHTIISTDLRSQVLLSFLFLFLLRSRRC